MYMSKNKNELPNPNEIYTLKCGLKCTCYLKPLLEEQKIENVEVGVFSYSYPDFANHILHHYKWLGDKLKIGKFTQIGKQVRFFMNGCNHKYNCISTFPFQIFKGFQVDGDMRPSSFDVIKGDTIIGNDVWIGDYTTIMPGVKIGDGAIIATNSHIVKDVPAYSVVGGNPAKVIRQRFDDEMIELLEKWQWWDLPVDEIDRIVVPILTNNDIEFAKSEIKKLLDK